MKIKTSITLSEDILQTVDQLSGSYKNRSEFIETAVRAFIDRLMRDQQNSRDLEILNRQAERLNQEAADVLSYQSEL